MTYTRRPAGKVDRLAWGFLGLVHSQAFQLPAGLLCVRPGFSKRNPMVLTTFFVLSTLQMANVTAGQSTVATNPIPYQLTAPKLSNKVKANGAACNCGKGATWKK